MRKVLVRVAVVVAAVAVLAVAAVGVLMRADGGRLRLPVAHTEAFDAAGIGLPALVVDGNEIRTFDGDVVVLRGVMPPDPEVLAQDGRFERTLVEQMADAGSQVVRVAVHPEYWRADPDYLWRYLDPIVRWAGDAGMYVILDWHSIGNVVTGSAPLMPDLYSHTYQLTVDFWTRVAAYFADTPHVVFEVFNEPQGISAADWQRAASDLVGVIRAQGATQPVIVGGLDYGRDLSWVLDTPVDDPSVIYASHIYPAHSAAGWDGWFGDVAQEYPVLITEWGFMDENRDADQAYLAGDAAGYGTPFLDRLDQLGAGWVACWWDDSWQPAMFTDRSGDDGEPTRYGQFGLDALRE